MNLNNNNICSICYENYTDNNKYTLECNHTFHSECIIKWFRHQKQNCPLCNDITLDLNVLNYRQRINTIQEIKSLGRKKKCPKNIKIILNKIKDSKEKYIEASKIYKKFVIDNKQIYKEIYNKQKQLRKNKFKYSRNIEKLEQKLLSIIRLNPIYL